MSRCGRAWKATRCSPSSSQSEISRQSITISRRSRQPRVRHRRVEVRILQAEDCICDLLRRVMPKLKTHRGAAKRFRTTATGKIKRGHSHARHILTKKTNKRKRYLDVDVMVSDGDQKRVERMLPYGRDY